MVLGLAWVGILELEGSGFKVPFDCARKPKQYQMFIDFLLFLQHAKLCRQSLRRSPALLFTSTNRSTAADAVGREGHLVTWPPLTAHEGDNNWLVVSTPLKRIVSWDHYSQHMESNKCSKPPTRQPTLAAIVVCKWTYHLRPWKMKAADAWDHSNSSTVMKAKQVWNHQLTF